VPHREIWLVRSGLNGLCDVVQEEP
jgi:hypothetical protein